MTGNFNDNADDRISCRHSCGRHFLKLTS